MAESGANKYIELYNPTQSTIFLSSTRLETAAAAARDGEFDYDVQLPRGRRGGSRFYVHHRTPQADSLILAVADMTYQYLSNGGDAFALLDITESP